VVDLSIVVVADRCSDWSEVVVGIGTIRITISRSRIVAL
jgi:hypothetical protein